MAISTINQNGLNAPLTLTSPVLTTPNLGTPSAVNLSNATALPASALPSGAVRQVIFGSTSTQANNATNVFSDTNLTATITPSSAANKILVLVAQADCYCGYTNGSLLGLRLVRNGTAIATFSNGGGFMSLGGAVMDFGTCSINYLDSPASTSAVIYKTQLNSTNNTGTMSVQYTGGLSTIVLMEIVG